MDKTDVREKIDDRIDLTLGGTKLTLGTEFTTDRIYKRTKLTSEKS